MVKKNKMKCCECNQSLVKDEIALSVKLLGKNNEDLYCINCLSEYLECSVNDLLIKIQEFKELGCTLFL